MQAVAALDASWPAPVGFGVRAGREAGLARQHGAVTSSDREQATPGFTCGRISGGRGSGLVCEAEPAAGTQTELNRSGEESHGGKQPQPSLLAADCVGHGVDLLACESGPGR